jgi:hypothetical protein
MNGNVINANNNGLCYVAFLDILGFKRILSAHSHEHLKSVYEEFCGYMKHGLSNGKYILSDVGENKWLSPDIQKATVNSLLESDSVLIWTDDNSAESFCDIVKATQSILAFSMNGGIPLRGAISIGSLPPGLNQRPPQTHDFQHSLIGNVLTKAEKNQEWSGCEITQAAIEFYKSNCSAGESLIEKKEVVVYPVPRKDGDFNGYVVDWVNHRQTGLDIQIVTDAFAPPISREASEWEKFKNDEWPKIKIKLCNTLKFVKHVKSLEKQVFVPWRVVKKQVRMIDLVVLVGQRRPEIHREQLW